MGKVSGITKKRITRKQLSTNLIFSLPLFQQEEVCGMIILTS